jgi:predicted nucleotide-binding protein (sugar kinase/HSP70/actin superfamily)
MKVAFPYMGRIHVPLAAILAELGAEPVVPPPPDREVLELGVRLAPEMMCIPFKLTLGNMVRSLEMGADVLLYTSGSWSCRYGYYGRIQQQILQDLGYEYRLIDFRHDQIPVVARFVVGLSEGSLRRALGRLARAVRIGWFKSSAVDEAEAWARSTAPFARDPSATRRLLDRVVAEVDRAGKVAELKRLRSGIEARFRTVPVNGRRHAVRVKVVGESYCTIEPFVSFDILRRLGELGVRADPFLTGHRWLGFHSFRIGSDHLASARQAAKKYWRYCVGGEDENSLGHLILAAEQGYDGVVHVHPFGCMPSTVVQPAMVKASQDYDIPYLSLSVDEHTSETGMSTRLEAFVSLLERRSARAAQSA